MSIKDCLKTCIILAVIFSLTTFNIVGSIIGAAFCGTFMCWGAYMKGTLKQ